MNSESTPHHGHRCANCWATLIGNYCYDCGQGARLHVPSAREFLHEFIAHYVALEGRLWKSLGLLIFRPGRLTREYIEGRRVRYIEPLRLYLTFSIIFFAVFKFSGIQVVQLDPPPPPPAKLEAGAAGKQGRQGPPPKVKEKAGETQGLEALVVEMVPGLRPKAAKFATLAPDEKQRLLKAAFFSYAPYAMFGLMPLFAFYLKLLYLGSGRRYGEHLLFALHTNAFAFLMLALVLLVPPGFELAIFGLVVWLALYLPKAMRRVYGGGRFVTAVRWLVLVKLHLASIAAVVTAATGLAALG